MSHHHHYKADNMMSMRSTTLLLFAFLSLVVGCSQSVVEVISIEPTAAPATATVPTSLPMVVIPTETTMSVPTVQPTDTATAIPATAEPTATLVPIEPVVESSQNGALISLTLDGNVGILLDGLSTDVRKQIVEDWLNAPPEEWEARALRQTRMARLRLNFRVRRNFYL